MMCKIQIVALHTQRQTKKQKKEAREYQQDAPMAQTKV
jgi:hypothetical protein